MYSSIQANQFIYSFIQASFPMSSDQLTGQGFRGALYLYPGFEDHGVSLETSLLGTYTIGDTISLVSQQQSLIEFN